MEAGFWRGAIRALVVLRLDGCIEADLLVEALHRLQRRHPKLRGVITRGRDGRHRYQFDQLAPPIPFQMTDYGDGERPWRDEARRLLHIPPPPAGPLAAVGVLRSRSHGCSELILSVHHSIADGRSAIMLVDDLLTEYAILEAQIEGPPRPALPAISPRRAVIPGGWVDRIWMFRRFVRLQRAEKRSRRTPLPVGRDIPDLSQWVHWPLARHAGADPALRKEKVSFSGVLVAAAFCGLMDCLAVSRLPSHGIARSTSAKLLEEPRRHEPRLLRSPNEELYEVRGSCRSGTWRDECMTISRRSCSTEGRHSATT